MCPGGARPNSHFRARQKTATESKTLTERAALNPWTRSAGPVSESSQKHPCIAWKTETVCEQERERESMCTIDALDNFPLSRRMVVNMKDKQNVHTAYTYV